eukprot:TRINITY_DN1969_c0_g1_i1.p1 TRINITY_DN1969_c0_g1~~TRINITY_DN1969_c0_g1_i1.p1  ORF type:complete len:742 (-),score=88.34 TRINITY_DN1969_c0_g1_i1:67-2292(-)
MREGDENDEDIVDPVMPPADKRRQETPLQQIARERKEREGELAFAAGHWRRRNSSTYVPLDAEIAEQMREKRRKRKRPGLIINSQMHVDNDSSSEYNSAPSYSSLSDDEGDILHSVSRTLNCSTFFKRILSGLGATFLGYPIFPFVLVYLFGGVVFAIFYSLFPYMTIRHGAVYWWAAYILILITEFVILEVILSAVAKGFEFFNVTFPLHYITKYAKDPAVFVIWGLVNRFTWDLIMHDAQAKRMFEIVLDLVLLFSTVFLLTAVGSQIITMKIQDVNILSATKAYLEERQLLKVLLNYPHLQHRIIATYDLKGGRAFRTTEDTVNHIHRKMLRGNMIDRFAYISKNMHRLNLARRSILNAAEQVRTELPNEIVVDDIDFFELIDLWMMYHKQNDQQHFGKGKFFHEHTFIPLAFSKEVAQVIFANLDVDKKGFIDQEDFVDFYPDRYRTEAANAFKRFDKRKVGHIMLHECTDIIQEILLRRIKVINTLTDRENVSEALRRVTNVFAAILALFLTPFVFGVNLATVIQTLSFFVLGFSFAFGNAIRVAVEGMVFILLQRSFDVGDLVHVNGYPQFMNVTRINILTTEMHSTDGTCVIIPNNVMYASGLYSYTRSKQAGVTVVFEASIPNKHTFWRLRDYMIDWMRSESLDLYHHEDFTFAITAMKDMSKVEIFVRAKLVNHSWNDAKIVFRGITEMSLAIVEGCKQFGIKIISPIQPVNVTGNLSIDSTDNRMAKVAFS